MLTFCIVGVMITTFLGSNNPMTLVHLWVQAAISLGSYQHYMLIGSRPVPIQAQEDSICTTIKIAQTLLLYVLYWSMHE